MFRRSSVVAVAVLLALAGSALATDYSPCPANSNQLCRDCVAGVNSLGSDGFGNTAANLKPYCPLCTSDLCKQCLVYRNGAFGLNYAINQYPTCTAKYLNSLGSTYYLRQLLSSASQVTGNSPSFTGVSTKALCPYITTSDTLSCFDYGYGSFNTGNPDLYGFFEALCVAANSDLQRRCMWQYTALTNFQGLPTNANAILKHALPLCLGLNSEAQYSCLKGKVADLNTALIGGTQPAATATRDLGVACGILPSSFYC